MIYIKFFFKIFFILFFTYLSFKFHFFVLHDFFTSSKIIFPYAIHPFDICSKNPSIWNYSKKIYFFTFLFSQIIISNFIYFNLYEFLKNIINLYIKLIKSLGHHLIYFKENFLKHKNSSQYLELIIGFSSSDNSIIKVPESGLYQNFIITGTIGSGKTSSAMYPFTKQFLLYNSKNIEKIGMLILDVKGNYYKQVYSFCSNLNLLNDLIVIQLNSTVFYNPLHKPNLKPQILANRLKTILLLFSENNSDSFWLDKAEEVICESIKLCRLYNDGYVTFFEIHKLISDLDYYNKKISFLKNLFLSNALSKEEIYEFNSSLSFFEKEFLNLDSRTKGIIISEITRITSPFISDYDVKNTFCSPKENLTFSGFDEVLKKGKIVILNMNIFEYSNLSKIIATYLKLDFQTEVMMNLSKNQIYKSCFICDEYDKFASKTDGEFFSLSREAKCINIVSTQSYSSLKNSLKDNNSVNVIIQNLINKIWFRTDDIFTIEEAQKQLGKEEKLKSSRSISENAKETNLSYITNTLSSINSTISESFSSYTQKEFKFDYDFFTQNLETFSALTFLSDGSNIYPPLKINFIPYFKTK